MNHSRTFVITSWTLRAVAAMILLQTLFFKFSGARESVYIFKTVGRSLGVDFMEPWGRIGSGVAELAASILLLLPQTVVLGSILSLGVISGAIYFHLTALGITLPAVDDHGELFALALIVFVCSLAILLMHRTDLPVPGRATSSALMIRR
jgi:putative oxidoreductase